MEAFFFSQFQHLGSMVVGEACTLHGDGSTPMGLLRERVMIRRVAVVQFLNFSHASGSEVQL